ncbi:MAG: hydrogen peroxide-inducible genes activator [Methylococcales bacterium]|jgi:LysR family transcriptional regulator, hydrogen peroxide-inducible genes activator|nr:hydrogen peroxide-inducible genes activator [Methylococcales bacterium]
MLSFKQLDYIIAVQKTKHFKKAAELCSVSQSALSTAISGLEKDLGLQIFERNNKKVLITPVGKEILEIAQKIKNDINSLYHLSNHQKSPLTYPLRIGVIPTVGPYLLPKVLPEIRNLHPKLKLTIVEEQSHVLLEMVRNGHIDFAILALPYAIDGLLSFEFWQEDFYLVTHKSNQLTNQKVVSSNQLGGVPLLLLKDGHCLKDHAIAACQLAPSELDFSMEGASLSTLIQMAAGKMGSTLVPQMALDQLLYESSELKALHLNDPGPHRKIAFICRLNYSGVANIEIFIKLFKQQLKNIF